MIPGNFNAIDNGDGTFLIQDVPIFCECERGEDVYDRDWIEKAFKRLCQAKSEGHRPPVHVHHHEHGQPKPPPAGMMSPKRIAPMRWRGKERSAIYVDILITDPEVFERIASKRLPYRSVEIIGGEIISCSLLDSEAPFIEMPMTTVRGAAVAKATNTPLEASTTEPVLAFRKAGNATHVLTEFSMSDDIKLEALKYDATNASAPFSWKVGNLTTSGNWSALKLFMEDGEEDKGEDAEEMEAGSIDAAAIVKAIESGEISIADYDAIRAAMDARLAPEAEDVEEAVEPPAPSDGPGDLMHAGKKHETTATSDPAKFDAKAHAAVIAMRAELDEIKAEKAAEDFAKATVAKFAGRGMGDSFHAEVKAFALKHGVQNAQATYDIVFEKTPLAAGPDFEAALAAQAEMPAEVRKFSHTAEAAKVARKANDEYEQLKKYTRLTREAYIRHALLEQGISPKE